MTTDPSSPAARPWRRIPLLGVAADDLSMAETIRAVDDMIASGSVHQHVVINVSKVVQADRDPALADLIRSCDLISVDGQPILWAARLLGTPLRARVAGVDLMERLIERAGERGYRVYLLGAREPVVRGVAQRIAAEHPGVNVVGWRDGYWAPEDEPAVVSAVVEADPEIVFVAMGSPTKERFLARWKDTIGAPFVMGVGGSFDVYAGTVRRAPPWMQRVGLEWLFRVAQEPGRMWRRYAGDAPRFVWIVLRARLSRR